MAQQQRQEQVGRQEGSRWIDRRPEPAELAQWFKENVRLHPGLDHAHYLPGITLIPNSEYGPDTGNDGKKIKHEVYTPYPMVDTRIQYFWDWCEVNDYLGEIEKLPAAASKYLPAGFFSMPIKDMTGRETPFVGISYRVHIWRPDPRWGGKGRPVRIPAEGTKVVPLLRKTYNGTIVPDENAIAKAQTGAQGRALGYAGMLIVPGAGIATAEDMQEFVGGEAAGGVEPALPPVIQPEGESAPASLEQMVEGLRTQLESEFPEAYEEATAWCHEKGYKITEPPEVALRGLERQLRRKVDQAIAKAGQ